MTRRRGPATEKSPSGNKKAKTQPMATPTAMAAAILDFRNGWEEPPLRIKGPSLRLAAGFNSAQGSAGEFKAALPA